MASTKIYTKEDIVQMQQQGRDPQQVITFPYPGIDWSNTPTMNGKCYLYTEEDGYIAVIDFSNSTPCDTHYTLTFK